MATIKVCPLTHGELRGLAHREGLSMKEVLRRLMAILREHELTPSALAEVASSHRKRQHDQPVLRVLNAQASKFLDPLLKKVSIAVSLLEQTDLRLEFSKLQTQLQRLEALLSDSSATLAAILAEEP